MITVIRAPEVAYTCDATGEVVKRKEVEGLPGGWFHFHLIICRAQHKNFAGALVRHSNVLGDSSDIPGDLLRLLTAQDRVSDVLVHAKGELEVAVALCARLGLPAAVECLRAGVKSGYTVDPEAGHE